MKQIIPIYRSDAETSYTPGAFTTLELLYNRPDVIEAVFVHPKFVDQVGLIDICNTNNIEVLYGENYFKRVNQKGNMYAVAVFNKYKMELSSDLPHVVLMNPSDMGNLGGAMRTLTAMNITNLAVITPAADIWSPKTLRASMGAMFHMQVETFNNLDEYTARFNAHTVYPFTPDGVTTLSLSNCPVCERYSLLFGCEASGLPAEFRGSANSLKLAQSTLVDSYNLSIAVGVGAFLFANTNGQL